MSWWTDVRDSFTAPFRNTVKTFDNIFHGGNVFDNIKAWSFGMASAGQGQIDAITGRKIGELGIPLVSDTLKAGGEVSRDPWNTGAQGRYFQKTARNAAITAAVVYGGPVIASQTGLSAGASGALAGKATYDLSQGNIEGALKTGLSAVGPISTPFGDISPEKLVSQFTQSVGTLPRSPVQTFSQPSQTLVYPQSKSNFAPILVFAGIAGITFLMIKKGKS